MVRRNSGLGKGQVSVDSLPRAYLQSRKLTNLLNSRPAESVRKGPVLPAWKGFQYAVRVDR